MLAKKYPSRLHHNTPGWVDDRAVFHIRIRTKANESPALTDGDLPAKLIESVHYYRDAHRWSCFLMVLLPDHLHALLSFARDPGMSRIVADWKKYHNARHQIVWQENFFDHRIRNGEEYKRVYTYIENNPVALGLCDHPTAWPHRCESYFAESIPRFD